MASAVTLNDSTPGDLIDIKGVVLEGVVIEPRALQVKTNKFWGVAGESRIYGEHGGRGIQIPVIIYDASTFDTPRKLANYIDYTLNTDGVGLNGDLEIISESNHSPFEDCSFEGALIAPGEGVKLDIAGTLGGGYFAICLLQFRQLGSGAAVEEEEDP